MLAPEFLNVWGGVGSYITELVVNLPKSIEVHVLTPRRVSFGKENIEAEEKVEFGDNVHVHYLTTAKDTFFYNAHFQYAVYKYAPGLIKREKIDLIHTHTAQMPDVLLRLHGRVRAPIVTTLHTTIKSQHQATRKSGAGLTKMDRSERMTVLLYPVLRMIEELYLRKGEIYITPSKYMKELLQLEYPNLNGKIKVIHNAVDTDFWKKIGRSKTLKQEVHAENVILYVGRLMALKGLFDLVKVIPQVLKEERDTVFVFIGTGEREKALAMLRRLKVPEEHYRFTGYIPRRRLIEFYNASTVFVLPSYGENMPMTLLEAMSCSLPVVTTDVGGIPEVVQHMVNGILVKPGDLRSFSDSITTILQDNNLRQKLAHNARKTIEERFSWKKILPQIVQTYQEAIEVGGKRV